MKICLESRSAFAFKIWILACIAFSMIAPRTWAGTIIGSVHAEGKAGADRDAASISYQSRKFKFVERINYAELRDFVVYIDQPLSTKPVPPAKPVQIVTQKDATFRPHVLPILVGTTVEWPNKDEIFHNVFSFSAAKSFDLGLYKEDSNTATMKKVVFDKPGRVDVFCSIHAKMHCVILVMENSHFAVANAKGLYSIPDVPAGVYQLRAWHERLPSEIKEVIVPETGEVKVDFTLGIKGLPEY